MIKVAIAGLGTVGARVARALLEDADFIRQRSGEYKIVALSAKNKNKDRDFDISKYEWEEEPKLLIHHADLVIELIGGADGDALAVVEGALARGKSVITANKALLAKHGSRLAALATANKAELRFEAAVAGAIPVIGSLTSSLAANRIKRLAGIMNGTCNFILSTMEASGREFADVLKQAQELGFAEADPSFDIDGNDTAHKLAVLAALAFGTALDGSEISTDGIRNISPADIKNARDLGYRIKLLGIAEETAHGISRRVHPCMVALDSPMASVAAEFNAVELEGSLSGPLFFEGRGAGADATASAVLGDFIDLLRGIKRGSLLPAANKAIGLADNSLLSGRYYLRLNVLDKPGVLAAVSTVFFETEISVKSCIQHSSQPGKPVDLVIVTHEATEAAIKLAMLRLSALDAISAAPVLIRMQG